MKTLIALLYVYSSLLFAADTPPRLIVQLVVDQLRGDLLTKYRQDFTADGFNYLLDHSINYQNAHHPHAYTVTCVGHATISTGSTPSLHGIVANDWYDPLTKQLVYCTGDPLSPILPTVRSTTKTLGQSPRNLIASTFSDELVLAQQGRAFAVSLKDRSAITLAGHAGKAFWFDKNHGGFITSQYYYHHYPKWANHWNSNYQPKNERWALITSTHPYHFTQVASLSHVDKIFGNQFPHRLGDSTSSTYYKHLAMSPFADELTADFAMTLLQKEKLGTKDKKTDYLAISFSAVDSIGHQFSPNSVESEENLRRLDITIANVLKTIDAQVGLQNVLIVLTADHGMPDSPSWLSMNHMQTVPAITSEQLQSTMNNLLLIRYKLPSETIERIQLPYVYLNHAVISKSGLSVADVSNYLAAELGQQAGLFAAYSLPIQNGTDDWLSNKVTKMNFRNRSGDLFLVAKPYQNVRETDDATYSHGSPWNYDSYVPLLFVNPNFKPTCITKLVSTTDIAPTLAALLSIKPPSASIGHPLREVRFIQ